jgi:hypothetical protein
MIESQRVSFIPGAVEGGGNSLNVNSLVLQVGGTMHTLKARRLSALSRDGAGRLGPLLHFLNEKSPSYVETNIWTRDRSM